MIFEAPRRSAAALEAELERAIEQRFELDVKVFVRTPAQLEAVAAAVPKHWIGNKQLRCNGVFLAREIDRPSLVAELEPKDEIEEVIYVKGTLLWAAKVASLTKSSMVKLSRRPEYKQMTVRNLNTTLKLRSWFWRLDVDAQLRFTSSLYQSSLARRAARPTAPATSASTMNDPRSDVTCATPPTSAGPISNPK